MCNLFTSVQISWDILEGSQGPSSAREFWRLLLGMFITFNVNSPAEESWTNAHEHLKIYFTDFHQLIRQLVRGRGGWGRISERVYLTTGQASRTSDVIAPACAGVHICVPWSSERIWFPAPHWVRWLGSPWVGTSVPDWGDAEVILLPAKGCLSTRIPSSSAPVNSARSLTSSLVERWNGTLCAGNTF